MKLEIFGASIVVLFSLLYGGATALASTGTIDPSNNFAWNDNGGWVNWAPSNGNVTVSDSTLTGYIWSADFGWINLSPSQGGVTNNGSGTLGGFAWGTNTGWISFSGVTIDTSTGIFHGHTVAQNVFGTMTFDCTNCKVVTSWRPGSATTAPAAGGGVVGGPLAVGYQNSSIAPVQTSSPRATPIPTTPSTLVPSSKPPRTQPSAKPPVSIASNAYTSQQVVLPQFMPTSTSPQQPNYGTSVPSRPAVATPTTTPAPTSCSWLGTCLFNSILDFFKHLF